MLTKEQLAKAITSGDPALVAQAQKYLDLISQPYYAFRPRPDCPEDLDEQSSYVNDQFPGLAVALGGTASGKTEASAYKAAKFIRTTPPPRKNTPFWIMSQSMEMTCGVCWQEKLSKYITSDLIEHISWHNQARGHPAAVILKPHKNGNNWVVEMKSYDMDRQRLQAASVGGLWADEASPHEVIVEALGRCRDYDFPGSKFYSLTPLIPTPELRDIYENRHRHPDWKFYRLNTRKNTALAEGWLDRFLASEIPDLRQTRLTGDFAALAGQSFHRDWFKTYIDLDDAYKLGEVVVKAEDCFRLVTVDLAISIKTSADWTVAQVWDITPHQHMILVHERRLKAEGPTIIAELIKINERFKPVLFGVESVAYQALMCQMLRQKGLPVKELLTGGKDKLARSARAQVKAESGQVWLPSANWVDEWLAEICAFPHSTFDDRVDAFSYAAILAAKQPIRELPGDQEDAQARLKRREAELLAG